MQLRDSMEFFEAVRHIARDRWWQYETEAEPFEQVQNRPLILIHEADASI
jgi:hypothetical protein